ncbi:hypothetical protein VUJ46_10665 [Chryseobacterium sp. MYb264]|uniref:tetratricopeptide repeat protein n=1 Tax=Chryseobacterium sp. MYb264 TaxID=2745153 RepID=UPI002E0E11A3|nr:hypothetical protein VUJ46_10665 [Chryseobacterium sp. MYb264]
MKLKIYLSILVIVPSFTQSQEYNIKDLIYRTVQYQNKADIVGALRFNQKALAMYKRTHNIEGVVTASINIGNLFCTLNAYQESLSYLDCAGKDIDKVKNPIVHARLYSEYGKVYSGLGLYSRSNVSFNKAIKKAAKIKDKKRHDFYLNYIYSSKWYNFDMLGIEDSVSVMQKKSMKLMPSNSLTFTKIADGFVTRKQHLDSASYYLNKALALAHDENDDKAKAYFVSGELYLQQKQPEQALKKYFQALKIFEKMRRKTSLRDTYRKISETYHLLNEEEKRREYFMKFTVVNDTVNYNERKVIGSTVEKLLVEQEEDEKNRTYFILGFVALLVTVLLSIIIKVYRDKHKKKDSLLKEKAEETDVLRKRVNESFGEIVEMAKEGSPFFLGRFKEIYQEFYEKLISQGGELTEHDIKFCAYIKLSLTNKEIARLENVTTRAIQTKRYRVKKKLELPAEVDLVKWIMEI